LVACLPQMLAWQAMYGSLIARSPVGPQIRWTDPHLVDILWSARNGLFSTTPILYLGAIGLVGFAAVRPGAGLPLLAAAGLMIYFNACIQDWWGSAGFGGRRFDGLIPMFCIGLAAFIESGGRLVRRHATVVVIALLAAIAIGNLALMGAAQAGAVRIGETLSFDRAWGSQARVAHGWFGNPFTYPASLVFALRNGVSPGDYDLLSTNRFLADPLLPYGRVDVGAGDEWLVVDGWHAPETEGSITYRWAASPARPRGAAAGAGAPSRVRISRRAASDARDSRQRESLLDSSGHTRLADAGVHDGSIGVARGRERSGAAVRLSATAGRRRDGRRSAAAGRGGRLGAHLSQQLAVNCELRTANCKLQTANCKL
jgi:hypothetical protein